MTFFKFTKWKVIITILLSIPLILASFGIDIFPLRLGELYGLPFIPIIFLPFFLPRFGPIVSGTGGGLFAPWTLGEVLIADILLLPYTYLLVCIVTAIINKFRK